VGGLPNGNPLKFNFGGERRKWPYKRKGVNWGEAGRGFASQKTLGALKKAQTRFKEKRESGGGGGERSGSTNLLKAWI